MKRYFIGIDPQASGKQVDFAVMTEKEVKEAEEEFESVFDYLGNNFDCWMEIDATQYNIKNLKKLAKEMEK